MNDLQIIHKDDNTIDGQCSRCGKCCSNILLLRYTEIDRIKKYLRKHKEFTPTIEKFTKEQQHKCPFLCKDNNDENYCFIYDVRPEICRKFSCNPKIQDDLMYNGLHAISMINTFFPSIPFVQPDLTLINKRISLLQKKLNIKY